MPGRILFHPLLKHVPSLFQALAVLAILAAVVTAYVQAQRNAARLLALRGAPPPAVAIETFEPWSHQGLAGEVRLVAQADLDRAERVDYRAGLGRTGAVVIPLVSTEAETTGAAPLGFVYYPGPVSELAAVPPATLLPSASAEGPVGPLVELGGLPGAPSGLRRAVAEAFALPEGEAVPLTLTPFAGGRQAALSVPIESGIPSALGAAALLCLVAALIARRLVGDRSHAMPQRPRDAANPPTHHLHKEPATDRARSRFSPLAEQTELSAAEDSAPEDPSRTGPGRRLRKLAGLD